MDRAVCTSEDWFYIRPVASFFFSGRCDPRGRRTKWDRRHKSLEGETRLSKAVLRALLKSICIYQTFKVQKWKTLLYFTIFAVRMTIFMSLFKKKKAKIERKLKIHIIRLVGEGLIVIIPSFVSLFSILTLSYHMYSVSIKCCQYWMWPWPYCNLSFFEK